MTRFDLFKEMDGFANEMDQVFRGLGFGNLLEQTLAPTLGARTYPRINLREEKEHYLVEALIPGIDPKELEMTVLKGVLTLSGERSQKQEKEVTWHRRERNTGKFMRAIDIPAEIDVDQVKADYSNGLLTVTLPKAASERPKRIEINAA